MLFLNYENPHQYKIMIFDMKLYDHYLRPNASFYAVRKGCSPVQLIYNYHQRDIRAVNSRMQPVSVTAIMVVYGVSGQLLHKQEKQLSIPAMASVPAFDPFELSEDNGYLFLTCESEGVVIAEN